MGKHYKADNSGGYGNPPVSGQFKEKGRPGPGRPKGSKSMSAAARKVYSGKIPFKENGEMRLGDVTEALNKKLLSLAMSGSLRALELSMKMAEEFGPKDVVEAPKPKFNLDGMSVQEVRTFGRLFYRALGKPLDERLMPNLLRLDDHFLETTPEGLAWNRSRSRPDTDELISVGNRAYLSAALPRKFGCDIDWPVPNFGDGV